MASSNSFCNLEEFSGISQVNTNDISICYKYHGKVFQDQTNNANYHRHDLNIETVLNKLSLEFSNSNSDIEYINNNNFDDSRDELHISSKAHNKEKINYLENIKLNKQAIKQVEDEVNQLELSDNYRKSDSFLFYKSCHTNNECRDHAIMDYEEKQRIHMLKVEYENKKQHYANQLIAKMKHINIINKARRHYNCKTTLLHKNIKDNVRTMNKAENEIKSNKEKIDIFRKILKWLPETTPSQSFHGMKSIDEKKSFEAILYHNNKLDFSSLQTLLDNLTRNVNYFSNYSMPLSKTRSVLKHTPPSYPDRKAFYMSLLLKHSTECENVISLLERSSQLFSYFYNLKIEDCQFKIREHERTIGEYQKNLVSIVEEQRELEENAV